MRVHKMDDGFRYEVESILYAQLLSLPRTITASISSALARL